jgi:HAD superfamily hydrolase (TIGR01509 family)
MKYKAIIFDMDGLLVDSEPVWHEVEIELIESAGYAYSDEVREMGVGMRVDEFAAILQRHYPKLGDSPAAIEAAITERMLNLPAGRIKARPGADELVNYAAELGIPRAIASSSSQVVIEHFVRLMGWDELIPQRYSAEFMARGKPAPDIYLHAAEQLGYAPANCLALEDSRLGTQAALAARMTCYTVPDLSHSSLNDFADINDKVYRNLHDILEEFKLKRIFA